MTMPDGNGLGWGTEETRSLRETALELIGDVPAMPHEIFKAVRAEFGSCANGHPVDERRLWRVLRLLTRIGAIARESDGYVRTERGDRLLADLAYLHEVECDDNEQIRGVA